MDFDRVATEIMLHVEDEKWYETRDKIAKCLAIAADFGAARSTANAILAADHRTRWTYQGDGADPSISGRIGPNGNY